MFIAIATNRWQAPRKNGVVTAQPGAQLNLLNSTVMSIEHAYWRWIPHAIPTCGSARTRSDSAIWLEKVPLPIAGAAHILPGADRKLCPANRE